MSTQRDEREAVEARGPGEFTYHRWLATFATVWRGIADEWGAETESMLATDEEKEATYFLVANGAMFKALTDESAVWDALTEIITQKSLAVVNVSEAEWLAIGEGVWSPARASTMANTEVVQATGWTQHETAVRAPLLLFKIWQSIVDERTRPTHLDANGQRRLLNEPFTVGSAELQWPADAGGPLQEIINCRCWENYELAEPARRR